MILKNTCNMALVFWIAGSASIISIQHSNWISFDFLINHGANVNYLLPNTNATPLKVHSFHIRNKNIDLNEQNNPNLETPLIFAIRYKRFQKQQSYCKMNVQMSQSKMLMIKILSITHVYTTGKMGSIKLFFMNQVINIF